MENFLSGILNFSTVVFIVIISTIAGILPSKSPSTNTIPIYSNTPTPEPLMPCNVGKNSLYLLNDRCSLLKNHIEAQKQIDSQAILNIISAINEKIKLVDSDLEFIKNKAQETNNIIDKQKSEGRYTFEQWSANLESARILLFATKDKLEAKYKLEDERDWYLNYLDGILFGDIGSGACSYHQGVDCSTSRGNIGQVICADGWDQSQVYYFNIKECVEYAETTLP